MRIGVRAGQAYGTGTFGRIAERKGQMERKDEGWAKKCMGDEGVKRLQRGWVALRYGV